MNKKAISLSFLSVCCLVFSTCLGACSPAAKRQLELSIWLDTNEKEMQFFRNALQPLKEKFPHYKLKLRFIAFDDLKPRFQGQVGETREPDILYMMNDWVGELVEQNLLRPLQLSESQIVPQAQNSMRYNQQLYGAPFVFQTVAMLYNRSLLKQAPHSDQQLLQLKQGLKAKDHYALIYDQRNFYYHAPWFHSCGGQIFDAQGRFALKAAPLVRSLSWATQLQQQGIVPEGASYSVMLNLFAAGQTPLMISGPWSLAMLRENELNYAVAALPQGACKQPPRPYIGVKGFGLNRMSPHPEAAEKVIAFLVSEAMQQRVLEELDNLPVHTEVLKKPLDKDKAVFYQQMQQGLPLPNHPLMKDVWQEMNWLLNQVFDGKPIESHVEQSVKRLQQKARDFYAS